jgi:hypothetical protein
VSILRKLCEYFLLWPYRHSQYRRSSTVIALRRSQPVCRADWLTALRAPVGSRWFQVNVCKEQK